MGLLNPKKRGSMQKQKKPDSLGVKIGGTKKVTRRENANCGGVQSSFLPVVPYALRGLNLHDD